MGSFDTDCDDDDAAAGNRYDDDDDDDERHYISVSVDTIISLNPVDSISRPPTIRFTLYFIIMNE